MILPFRIRGMIFKDASVDPDMKRAVASLHHSWSVLAAHQIHGDRWVDYCRPDEYEDGRVPDIYLGVFDLDDNLTGAWLLYNIVVKSIERGRVKISAMPAPTLRGDWRESRFWARVGDVLDWMLENEFETSDGNKVELVDWRFPSKDGGNLQHIWPRRICGAAFDVLDAGGRVLNEDEYDDETRGRMRERYIKSVRRQEHHAAQGD